jgi:hypothetical protein
VTLELVEPDESVVVGFDDIVRLFDQGKTFKYFTWAAENATVPVYYSRKGESGMVDGGG